MRVTAHCLFIVFVGAAPFATAQPSAPPKDAATVLAAAREALGGEARLSAVKTFAATGRTRQVRGDNLVPIEFEILCELPSRCVRTDEIPAQESGPTSTGYNGDDLIQAPPPMAPPSGGLGPAGAAPPAEQVAAMRQGRVAGVKQDFVRLTLGMFAGSFSAYPLTFTYAGQAEAPQGKADVLDVKGPGTFAMKLFVNSQTHLPIMVSWQAQTPPMRGMPPGAGGPVAGRGPGAAPAPGAPAPGAPPSAGPSGLPAAGSPSATPVEHRLYYGDYREIDGLQWPFRLRRATGADTIEETTFDRFRINGKIDQRKFEVRK